jgi:TRAP-type C4-dicarboxylate transport system substrate-binding protein
MRKTLVALLAVSLAAPCEAQVTLKLGTLAPAGSAWHELLNEMAARWDAASGGRVKLRVYPGGVQGGEGEMVRKMGIGQLQAAALTNVGMHDITPEPQAMTVPMLFASEAEMACVFEECRGRMEAAFEARDFVVLQWSRVGSVSFFCNAPFATPAAFATAKVFASEGDPAAVEAWRAAGFQPVELSSAYLVPALMTRMVDCVGQVPLYMLTTRAFERARYLIDLPWGFVVSGTVVRRDAWERVPADLRPALIAIARELGTRLDAEALRLEEDAVAAMRRQGLEIVAVDPTVWRPVLELSWPVLRGGSIPADFFDAVRAGRDRCRALAPPAPPRPVQIGAIRAVAPGPTETSAVVVTRTAR